MTLNEHLINVEPIESLSLPLSVSPYLLFFFKIPLLPQSAVIRHANSDNFM